MMLTAMKECYFEMLECKLSKHSFMQKLRGTSRMPGLSDSNLDTSSSSAATSPRLNDNLSGMWSPPRSMLSREYVSISACLTRSVRCQLVLLGLHVQGVRRPSFIHMRLLPCQRREARR
mmetsp:Transcript_3705/g.13244  ORF Transcript_3705/g.13244 Transcript_3705/m.13244 type:complete len:119 (+) Transcript_3705:748-1104(+)